VCVCVCVCVWSSRATRVSDMTHSYVCVTFLLSTHVCHDSFVCHTWLIHTCDMICRRQHNMRDDSFVCTIDTPAVMRATWLLRIYHRYTGCLCVWHDSHAQLFHMHYRWVMRVTWLIHTWDMPDLFISCDVMCNRIVSYVIRESRHVTWMNYNDVCCHCICHCIFMTCLQNICDKLAKFERTNAILVEYIKREQYFNLSPKNTRINGTVWFSICVVKKWPFCTRCEQHRHFGRYLSWYGVVNSNKTHMGNIALILLYLLKNIPCLCAKYK